MERPASIWVRRDGLQRPADDLGHVGAAEYRKREKAGLDGCEIDARNGEQIVGGEDQHQHRRAAYDVDIGANGPANHARSIGEQHAEHETHCRSCRNNGNGDLDGEKKAVREGTAGNRQFMQKFLHWTAQNLGNRRSAARSEAASARQVMT